MKYLFLIVAFVGLVAGQVFEVENDYDENEHKDCHSLFKAGYMKNGTYKLTLSGKHYYVPCEFRNGWGFTIFLYRVDGVVNWARSYQDYETGFGYPVHDFFAGLQFLHAISHNGKWALDSTFLDWNNKYLYSINSPFSVGDRSTGYQLSVGHQIQGNVGDSMSYSNGQKFYTVDFHDPHHCVDQMRGGWWYNFCSKTLPTGHYYNHGHYTTNKTLADGIFWSAYQNPLYSLKRFAMSVRPLQ